MIDEKKLIEVIENVQNHMREANKKSVPVDAREIFTLFIGMVQKQPKIGEWIPIGQLPSEECLLMLESGHMFVGFYDYDEDCWMVNQGDGFARDIESYDMDDGEPVAWMPLPGPYRKEE